MITATSNYMPTESHALSPSLSLSLSSSLPPNLSLDLICSSLYVTFIISYYRSTAILGRNHGFQELPSHFIELMPPDKNKFLFSISVSNILKKGSVPLGSAAHLWLDCH